MQNPESDNNNNNEANIIIIVQRRCGETNKKTKQSEVSSNCNFACLPLRDPKYQ